MSFKREVQSAVPTVEFWINNKSSDDGIAIVTGCVFQYTLLNIISTIATRVKSCC